LRLILSIKSAKATRFTIKVYLVIRFNFQFDVIVQLSYDGDFCSIISLYAVGDIKSPFTKNTMGKPITYIITTSSRLNQG